MRCGGGGANPGRGESSGRARKWKDLARRAKPAGLAKGGKAVRSQGMRGRPTGEYRFSEAVLNVRLTDHGPGGGRKPGGGAGGQHGGAMLELELHEDLRHEQPARGSNVTTAISTSIKRRVNMVSLHLVLGGKVRTAVRFTSRGTRAVRGGSISAWRRSSGGLARGRASAPGCPTLGQSYVTRTPLLTQSSRIFAPAGRL